MQKNPKKSTKRILQLIHEFSKVTRLRSIHKTQLIIFLHTKQTELIFKISFTIASKDEALEDKFHKRYVRIVF